MGDINEIINYRVKRSDEAFEDALILQKAGRYTSTVNRLYYSAFYAVSALLLKDGIYSKSHSGLKSKFNERVIKQNKVGAGEGEIYNELFEHRQDADYKDFVGFTKEEIDRLIEGTKKLISEIKKLINDDAFTD
jgi:uncharacterized protein (UPF0332 family)